MEEDWSGKKAGGGQGGGLTGPGLALPGLLGLVSNFAGANPSIPIGMTAM